MAAEIVDNVIHGGAGWGIFCEEFGAVFAIIGVHENDFGSDADPTTTNDLGEVSPLCEGPI